MVATTVGGAPSAYAGGMEDRASLSEEEVALVLRRASELQAQRSHPPGTELDVAAVVEIGREVGLDPAAVRQAAQEVRTGLVPVPAPARRGLLPPDTLTLARRVPGEIGSVSQQVGDWLHSQWFEPCRTPSVGVGVWRPRTGFIADVRRSVDLDGRLGLRGVRELKVTMTPEGDDQVLVRFDVDLRDYRLGLVGGLVAAPAATGAGLGVLLAALLNDPLWFAAFGGGGGALAAAGLAGAHRAQRARREGVGEVLAGLLDRLQHPTWNPAPWRRLPRLVRR